METKVRCEGAIGAWTVDAGGEGGVERERDGGRNREMWIEIDEARGKREWALQRAQAKGRGEVEAGGVW